MAKTRKTRKEEEEASLFFIFILLFRRWKRKGRKGQERQSGGRSAVPPPQIPPKNASVNKKSTEPATDTSVVRKMKLAVMASLRYVDQFVVSLYSSLMNLGNLKPVFICIKSLKNK